jgi:hypothetical protein
MFERVSKVAYPRFLDLVCDSDKQLLVLGRIFASHEYLNGESATLELVEMLGCISRQYLVGHSAAWGWLAIYAPFFAVVRM